MTAPTKSRLLRKIGGHFATVGVLLIVVIYGLTQLNEPVGLLIAQSHTSVGLHAVTDADSVVDIAGTHHPMMAKDSATLLILLDAHCGACRMNATDYVELAHWSGTQQIAARLILDEEKRSAAQFGRLAGDESAIMMVPNELFVKRFNILSTPSVVLIDRAGVIRGRWLGGIPRHLEVLNVLGRIKR